MKEQIFITKDEELKAESFVDTVCGKNHILSCFGTVSLALQHAMSLTEGEVKVEFMHTEGGVMLSLTRTEGCFSKEDFQNEKDESMFLLKALCDKTEISSDMKTLSLSFFVSGISQELLLFRQEKIGAFSQKQSHSIV